MHALAGNLGHVRVYLDRDTSLDVDIPFAYTGSKYDRHGRYVGGLSGSGALAVTLGHHEYARVHRVE